MVILALDQATQISGFSVWIDGTLNTYGKKEYDDADIHKRIHRICMWIEGLIDQYATDKLVIEEIHYQPNIGITTF